MRVPVIAIFDIGKTNKKFILFDEQYQLVYESSCNFSETTDEDGFPCEDLDQLNSWIWNTYLDAIHHLTAFDIKAVNFSAYGASFVLLDDHFDPLTALYNYLKPFPDKLQKQFNQAYGAPELIAKQTASPTLGNLNSGMQLYRIKYEKPDVFSKIHYALHLPQYLAFLLSSSFNTDITSIGCHTALWDFQKNNYHDWVYKEGITEKFAPICIGDPIVNESKDGRGISVGIGLHDSSAALIPYLSVFHEPFILLSTGTWCISINPFNDSLLTDEELAQDCLCYITYQGKPVKASRLFAGFEHEEQTKRLAAHYQVPVDHYKTIDCDSSLLKYLQSFSSKIAVSETGSEQPMVGKSEFASRDLNDFDHYEKAYHQLMLDIMQQQLVSTKLVLKNTKVKRIFVDGGFSKNPIYMYLLAAAFPEMEVFAASVAQASSLGAAISIHKHWNKKSLPGNLIDLRYYTVTTENS